MRVSGPQAVADEYDKGPHHLMADTGGGPLAEVLGVVQVQAVQQAVFERVQ